MGSAYQPVLREGAADPGARCRQGEGLARRGGRVESVVELMAVNNPEGLQAAQVIQAMAKESGFDIRIKATEFASSLQLGVKGDFEAYQIGWSGRTDPDGNIYNFVSCKAPPALNTGHYCNQDVDRELDAARTVGAPDERLA